MMKSILLMSLYACSPEFALLLSLALNLLKPNSLILAFNVTIGFASVILPPY